MKFKNPSLVKIPWNTMLHEKKLSIIINHNRHFCYISALVMNTIKPWDNSWRTPAMCNCCRYDGWSWGTKPGGLQTWESSYGIEWKGYEVYFLCRNSIESIKLWYFQVQPCQHGSWLHKEQCQEFFAWWWDKWYNIHLSKEWCDIMMYCYHLMLFLLPHISLKTQMSEILLQPAAWMTMIGNILHLAINMTMNVGFPFQERVLQLQHLKQTTTMKERAPYRGR